MIVEVLSPNQLPSVEAFNNPVFPPVVEVEVMPGFIAGGGAASAVWGNITGTLSAQTDLQTALNTKLTVPASPPPAPTTPSQTVALLASYGLCAPATPPLHLLNTLISYWKLDEAGVANKADSVGSNTLGVGGSVTSQPGIINNGLGVAGAGNASINSNPTLQVTGDFTFSCWAKIAVRPTAATNVAVGKWGTAGYDYLIAYDTSQPRGWCFGAAYDGVSALTIAQVGLDNASLGVWYHLVGWYDSIDQKARLRINDAATYTAATGAPLFQRTAAFAIGTDSDGNEQWNGVIDEVGFWKRKLTAAEITALYNGGAGLPFSSFTP